MGIATINAPASAIMAMIPPPKANLFTPIASDLEETERILNLSLANYFVPVSSQMVCESRKSLTPLLAHLKHYRGKRLRPALLLLTAKARGKVTPAHHTLAAAVEMIHTATLVHDDVLDEAKLRRHIKTVNSGWGNKVSILLGDMLFTHAFYLASTIDSCACKIIGEATNRVCAGELQQVANQGNLELAESDYFSIIDGKTAALTECCTRLGAYDSGASEMVVEKLARFGKYLGLAFQITDDVLDLVGDEETVGKTLGTDLEQRKLTLPLIHCLSSLKDTDASSLRNCIESGELGFGKRVLAAVRQTHSDDYARQRAEEFARTAREELECLPRSECRNILESIAEWSVRRDR